MINDSQIYKEASDLYRKRDLPFSNFELKLIQNGTIPSFSTEKLYRFIPSNKRVKWYYDYSIKMLEKEQSIKHIDTLEFSLFTPFTIVADVYNDFFDNMSFFLSTLKRKDI